MTITPSVRNAAARALIADVTLKDLPRCHAEQTTRQTMLAQTVARAHGVPFKTARAAVIEAWPKVYGIPYAKPGDKVLE